MRKIAAFLLVFIICFSVVSPSAIASSAVRNTYLEEDLAINLKCLGLFNGVTDTDFDLTRAPTRTEALVMLIRALGKEDEALNGNWTHPFIDVVPWADKYVGYAYENGLINGISETQFGTGSASACTYLTFVLRALGYSDTDGADFTWDNPFTLAKSQGILPERVEIADFLRADVVLIFYSALQAGIKGTTQSLADKLIGDGVFTRQQYDTYYDADALSSYEAQSELSAEEIYAECSPAVFYLEVYDSKGNPIGNGSGFFIDSQGTAVTNYHVLDGAYSAKITVSDTNTDYNVLGIYDYNETEDWAILKIDGSGFSYLKLGDSSAVVGGETVYSIGSPLGLQDTIAQGIVSNPNRQINGVTFIQNSTAINMGSSGGVLVNKYGEVIGITTGTFDFVSLNLAVPVNYFKNYSTAAVKTLLAIAMNANSKLIPYSEYQALPDCGAYYGVGLFSSSSTSSEDTYYYSIGSLLSAGTWLTDTGYPKYLDILSDWGFEYINEFSVGSSYYWQFALRTDAKPYIVMIGTTNYNNIDCLSVRVIRA